MDSRSGQDRAVWIRDCTDADLAATLEISNELIPTTTIAWTEHPLGIDERTRWFAEQLARGFPVLVADDAGTVVGVASYGDFRDTSHWEGYRFSVELSIHVRGDRRGDGIGRRLMEALVDRATAAGVHVMVAAVDGDNVDSIRFHERLGFVEVARMPEVGFKFGRWLDLVLLQLTLRAG
jgi:L-amino acid N-acyltransferase YncA